MSEFRQKQIPKRQRKKKEESEETVPVATVSEEEKLRKLKDLDEFMEGVLQEAGQEFLDEFKQVEGE